MNATKGEEMADKDTSVDVKLNTFGQQLNVKLKLGDPLWSPVRWFCGREFRPNELTDNFFLVLSACWLAAFIVSGTFFFISLLQGSALVILPLMVLALHGLLALKYRQEHLKTLMHECRWLTQDADVHRRLCEDESWGSKTLRQTIIQLQEYEEGELNESLASVLQQVIEGIDFLFGRDQVVSEISLIERFGSDSLKASAKAWLEQMNSDEKTQKAVEKALKEVEIDAHSMMQDRVKSFEKAVLNAEKPAWRKAVMRWWFAASNNSWALSQGASEFRWYLLGTCVLIVSIIISVPILLIGIAMDLQVQLFGLFFACALFGGLSYRDLKETLSANAACFWNQAGVDLVLTEMFVRRTRIGWPFKNELELLNLEAMCEDQRTHIQSGFALELRMRAVLRAYQDVDALRERRFKDRCGELAQPSESA